MVVEKQRFLSVMTEWFSFPQCITFEAVPLVSQNLVLPEAQKDNSAPPFPRSSRSIPDKLCAFICTFPSEARGWIKSAR